MYYLLKRSKKIVCIFSFGPVDITFRILTSINVINNIRGRRAKIYPRVRVTACARTQYVKYF